MIVEFDDYRFEATPGELVYRGAALRLRPQAAALLADLIRHRSRWVTRGELAARVWGGLRVSSSSHSTLLAEVRRAVGDDGRSQRVIRTCRRRGHRFVARVSIVVPSPRSGPPNRPMRCELQTGWAAAADIAERSLAGALRDGPRHLAVSGPCARAFAREWAEAAADRGWGLHAGRRVDDDGAALGPWRQIASSLRDGDGGARAEWSRLVREIEWLGRHGSRPPEPATERQRRCAVSDGLARALRRRACRGPLALWIDGRRADDVATERMLAFVLSAQRPVPIWIVTSSRSSTTPPCNGPRTDVVSLAPRGMGGERPRAHRCF